MHRVTLSLRVFLCAGLTGLIIAATAQQPRPRGTLIGRWEWVSTQFNGHRRLTPATERETTTLAYNPDSTVDQYRNGRLVDKNRPFSVRRIAHPSGSGVVDVMICPDETGFVEPFQTVWIKGARSDTLVFMGLDPDNDFKPLIYSIYRRVTE